MLPNYAQNALIYLKQGIEDYPIFENRTVEAGIGQEWPIDSLLNQLKIDDETLAKITLLTVICIWKQPKNCWINTIEWEIS